MVEERSAPVSRHMRRLRRLESEATAKPLHPFRGLTPRRRTPKVSPALGGICEREMLYNPADTIDPAAQTLNPLIPRTRFEAHEALEPLRVRGNREALSAPSVHPPQRTIATRLLAFTFDKLLFISSLSLFHFRSCLFHIYVYFTIISIGSGVVWGWRPLKSPSGTSRASTAASDCGMPVCIHICENYIHFILCIYHVISIFIFILSMFMISMFT